MTTGCLASDIILLLIVFGALKLFGKISIGVKAEQQKEYCKRKIEEITEEILKGEKQ